jgi:hypothetical protein
MTIHSSRDIIAACRALAARLGQDGMDTALHLPDADYVCLSPDGVRFFGQRFLDWLKTSGLKKYVEERNDCDDFALHAHSFAKQDHARFYHGEAALAFGEAWIFTDTQSHALNAAMHPLPDGTLTLALYEPQLQWNDQQNPFVPYMSMRPFPLESVRRWQYLRF